jgi:hypothetical protein
MAKMIEIVCKCGCGRKRMVRQADYDRGWGRFFDKTCKARHQERKTGQYDRFIRRGENDSSSERNATLDSYHPFSSESLGQW